MSEDLPEPRKGAIFYEDEYTYAALANQPLVYGHVVVVWKEKVGDFHLLKRKEYEHLMDIVDIVRNSLLKSLEVEKVYLMYMDEVKHVHWHLVPRYKVKGMRVFENEHKILRDTSLAEEVKQNLEPLK